LITLGADEVVEVDGDVDDIPMDDATLDVDDIPMDDATLDVDDIPMDDATLDVDDIATDGEAAVDEIAIDDDSE